jgi:hypothetical protein
MPVDSLFRPPFSAVQPGAYSAVDASALQGGDQPTAPFLVIVGAAFGGQPNVLQRFRDPQALKNRLRSGAGYDCARFAMSAGANPIGFIRAGSTISQAVLVLQNAGATTVVTLTSLDYGAWTNNIKVTVAANNSITISYTDTASGITYNEVYNLGAGATNQNIADAINGKKLGYNASQYVSATVGAGAAPLSVLAQTPLAGGSDGTSSALQAGDWTSALAALEGEALDMIVPATGDATVHAQVQTHCDSMSVPAARKERTCVTGGVLGENVATVTARMASLTSKRTQLVYPGIVDFDNAGVLRTWDPFYAAAKIAAMHVIQPDAATALIHQIVPVVDLEQVGGKYLSTAPGSDVDSLLRANVTPLTPAPGGGVWVVDSLSGWTSDDTWRDFHKTRSADVVQQRLRTRLESLYVGKKSLNNTSAAITDSANGILQGLKDETLIRDFAGVTVQQGVDARTYNVTAPVLLADATKFIYITVALQPASLLTAPQTVDTAATGL